MIELEVYARGLRKDSAIMHLRSQMDLLPRVRYKIDPRHDLVYFEIDESEQVTLQQIDEIFTGAGLHPRFVGQIPDALRRGTSTMRLTE